MGVVITHKQMEFWKRNITAVVGMLIFSMGINFFIVPADLYNGGVLGVSQIIRTFLVRYLHLFSGSTDIVGMFFTKKFKGFSVGRISLMLNAVVYGICAVLFGVQTAIYCIIYSAVSMLVTDRTHTQNINAEVIIFTKKEPVQIMDYIVKQFKRDATWWEAKGGYTEEKTYMTIVILSKYECAQLRRELKQIDEHAFVVEKDGLNIMGRFEKHL